MGEEVLADPEEEGTEVLADLEEVGQEEQVDQGAQVVQVALAGQGVLAWCCSAPAQHHMASYAWPC